MRQQNEQHGSGWVSHQCGGDAANGLALPLQSLLLIKNGTHDCAPQTHAFCDLWLPPWLVLSFLKVRCRGRCGELKPGLIALTSPDLAQHLPPRWQQPECGRSEAEPWTVGTSPHPALSSFDRQGSVLATPAGHCYLCAQS